MERRRGRKEDEVRARGFTLTELIIGLTLLLLVAMLTFPLYSKHASLRRQREAKTQLAIIQQAEEQYWLLHGIYTSDPARLAGWKDRSGRYTFTILEATPTTFKAQATGNIDLDATLDVWVVDELGSLINTICDVGLK